MDPVDRHALAPDASFDGGDLDCGNGLLLLIRGHIDPLRPGQLLEIRSTETSVDEDLPAWCRMTGNDLVSFTKTGGQRSFLVRKAGAGEGELSGPKGPTGGGAPGGAASASPAPSAAPSSSSSSATAPPACPTERSGISSHRDVRAARRVPCGAAARQGVGLWTRLARRRRTFPAMWLRDRSLRGAERSSPMGRRRIKPASGMQPRVRRFLHKL